MHELLTALERSFSAVCSAGVGVERHISNASCQRGEAVRALLHESVKTETEAPFQQCIKAIYRLSQQITNKSLRLPG